MKVLVVDDSDILRERLIAMIGEIDGMVVAGEAKGERMAGESYRRLRPEVVVLDIRLEDGDGIGVLKAIRKESPLTKVIMFTNYTYPQYRLKCMQEGADYFFDKSTEFEQMRALLAQLADAAQTTIAGSAERH